MSLIRTTQFFQKYKLLHIAFWVFATVSFFHVLAERLDRSDKETLWAMTAIFILFEMLCVYAILYLWTPRYLARKKYLKFIAAALATIGLSSLLCACTEDMYQWLVNDRHIRSYFISTVGKIFDYSLVVAIFLAVHILSSQYRMEQKALYIEKERLETELNYLKLQINPHFLFNALNSIFVLINFDKKIAGDALLKFSGLLRYQLYECADKDFVDVSRELRFLYDYIELEKLRNGENIIVDFLQEGVNTPFAIAPFLLIPFVENAFKHLSHYPDQENFVKVKAGFINKSFTFTVQNSYEEGTQGNSTGGIGLNNVSRRLQLLYPSLHDLEIKKHNNIFTVNLVIYASKNELHYS